MIKVNGIAIKPTIFPDGTSQIWKLPEGLLKPSFIKITWYFENEREIIDLCSFKSLLKKEGQHTTLYMPYLPYARQDKEISNETTFNLHTFASIINSLNFSSVLATDVHNITLCSKLINNFRNLDVEMIQDQVLRVVRPTYTVFPDAGAKERYKYLEKYPPTLSFEKVRNPLNGNLTSVFIPDKEFDKEATIPEKSSYLIIDDICDGGATFINIANILYNTYKASKVSLFVTHGIFSKGRKHLEDAGITLYTTNSLLKNVEGISI